MAVEYTYLVHTMETAGPVPDEMTSQELSASIAPDLQSAAKQLPELIDDWEVVSHSTFPTGRFLLTTYLLRRSA